MLRCCSPVWVPHDSCISAHETNIDSCHYSHTYALPTTRSNGSVPTAEHLLLVLLPRPQGNSNSTRCFNTRCCCISPCCNTRYLATMTPVQVVVVRWRLLTGAVLIIVVSTSTHMQADVATTFGPKMSRITAYFTTFHKRYVSRDEPRQLRHDAWVAETARSVVCTPTTLLRL